MDRGIITISETGTVTMPTVPVWMTQFEIADLFGVFSCDIRKAIHSIYKNKKLNELDTMKYLRQADGISYDAYSLEMIVAIAFSICSKESISFRRFVIIVIVKTCSDSLFSIGQKNCQLFVAKLRNFLDSHNRMVLY